MIVNLIVRPEFLEEFIPGLHANARATLGSEPGCIRFDVHRSDQDANHFILYEIYTCERAFFEDHREAPHYAAWKSLTARCLVSDSHTSTYASPVFPEDIPEYG